MTASRGRTRATLAMAFALALPAAAGCEQRKRQTKPPVPEVQTREILGKTTQDIRPMEPEVAEAGAVEAPTKITAKDPISMGGNAYVVSINHIAFNNVKHALDLYQAETGAYPKSHDEFMAEVVKQGRADGIKLPTLPYYQEYSYDVKEHKLVVLEYPDRKAQFQQQQDAKVGRD